MLVRHEGLSLKPYVCTAGFLTIGVGHNIEANPLPEFMKAYLDENGEITHSMASILLASDLEQCFDEAELFPFFEELNEARQAVVISMIFNLGLPRFMLFKKLISALSVKNYEAATKEMLNSRWAKQVGMRAKELAHMMKTGAYAKRSKLA
jgi:lysozyme